MIDECYLHPPTAFIAAQVIFRPARRQCTLPLSIACMYPFKEKSLIGLLIQHVSHQNKSTRLDKWKGVVRQHKSYHLHNHPPSTISKLRQALTRIGPQEQHIPTNTQNGTRLQNSHTESNEAQIKHPLAPKAIVTNHGAIFTPKKDIWYTRNPQNPKTLVS